MTWDDKPQKFISWWTNSSSDPRSNITLKDLLSFTSGPIPSLLSLLCLLLIDLTKGLWEKWSETLTMRLKPIA